MKGAMTMTTQEKIVELTEADCKEILSGMFQAADVHPNWPASTKEVAEVLRSGGAYDVSVVLLESMARSASVGSVPIRAGKFAWTPGNVLAAAGLANASRLWLLDSKHIAKMTAVELAELQARAVGESVFSDLDDVDIQTLVGVISNTEDRELRSTLCCGLVAKLRHDGVIL